MTRAAVRRLAAHPLAWIMLLAITLRVAAMSVANIHHPDEIFQYLEAAHRTVFGYGVQPWEYRAGIRTWLFPMTLSVPMAIGEWIDPDGSLYLLLPRLAMVGVSLALPWSAWMLGRRVSRLHGAMAAFVVATWAEFVYFAPHTLSENAGIALALPAWVLISGAGGRTPTRRLVMAGMLLGFAAIVRFQFAPALAMFAIAGCGRDPHRWRALVGGGLMSGAIGAGVDIAHGMVPFGWLVENVRQNLVEDRAAQYGTLGPLGYITWFAHLWGWWLVPIIPLVRMGMKRQPALFWAGVANLVFHSLIAHKEYRFVEFSAVVFILIASLGSVDVGRTILQRQPRIRPIMMVGGIAALWITASATMSGGREMRRNWTRATDTLAATALMRADPRLCGVALLPDLVEWGGYTHLHRRVPVSYFDRNDPLLRAGPKIALRARAADYNRIIGARADASILPPNYRRQACFASEGGGMCLYARAGGCTPDWRSPFLLDTIFTRIDRQMRDQSRRGQRSSS